MRSERAGLVAVELDLVTDLLTFCVVLSFLIVSPGLRNGIPLSR